MADYPSLPQVYDTVVTALDASVSVTQADDGTAWVRHLGDTQYEARVVHIINATDRDTVLSHYAAHTLLDFTWTASEDSATYTMRYVAPPAWQVLQAFDGAGHLFRVESVLRGTRD